MDEQLSRDRSDFSGEMRPLYVPVIVGTVRKGRMSAHAARLIYNELAKRANIETELIDIAKMPLPVDVMTRVGRSKIPSSLRR